ncbi:MAG: hypothetical protein RIS92_1432 [Verrucomicrobiota bacterium]
MMVSVVTNLASTSPEVMVFATAVPTIAPPRLVMVARRMAWRGWSTRVETTVAMELAVSWKPLMYSKMSATKMTVRRMVMVLRSS